MNFRAKLEETKLAQKLREKPNGVNIVGLAIGEKVKEEELLVKVSKLDSVLVPKLSVFLISFRMIHSK